MTKVYIFISVLSLLLALLAYNQYLMSRPEPEIELSTIYAITMDESCFNQLKNSDMVQIKILNEKN